MNMDNLYKAAIVVGGLFVAANISGQPSQVKVEPVKVKPVKPEIIVPIPVFKPVHPVVTPAPITQPEIPSEVSTVKADCKAASDAANKTFDKHRVIYDDYRSHYRTPAPSKRGIFGCRR